MHENGGTRLVEVGGTTVPRNYGDPAAEYRAARDAAGVVDRADRALVRAHGRDPVKMTQGLITNDIAAAPDDRGVYAAVLTPKGKMVADLRVFRRPEGELLLDVDRRALDGLLKHLKKFVPPLFATFENASEALHMIGVYGPESRACVASVLGIEIDDALPEDAVVIGSFEGSEITAVRTLYTGDDGWDLIAPGESVESLRATLVEAGATPVGHATLDVLRIEAGRPRWGAELDEKTIPLEAGIEDRAISMSKGCYTGQEIIVRILHRGHVNWHLRGFLLGEEPAPAVDTPLMLENDSKRRARITSACDSPLMGQTIALGYARREIDPSASLRLGGPTGPEAVVVELPFDAATEQVAGRASA